jgi:hypothetical protein
MGMSQKRHRKMKHKKMKYIWLLYSFIFFIYFNSTHLIPSL